LFEVQDIIYIIYIFGFSLSWGFGIGLDF
jgi:hypothetical protein